jgi:ribokinase
MMRRIAVVGSTMVDLVTTIERMPVLGETLEAPRFEIGHGGKGANQAAAAAKLGADVMMVGRVGDDVFGGGTIANLQGLGIDTTHMAVVAGTSSGVAPIFVDGNGDNSILIVKGANDHLRPADIEAAGDDLRGCGLLLLQLEIPLETVYAAIDFARENRIRVVLNPAPASPSLSLERIAGVDFFMPNQTELAILTGLPTGSATEAEIAARTLLSQGIGAIVVTLGADGALLVTADAVHVVPPVMVQAVDTSGAGDAFIGAFAARYVEDGDVPAALAMAARYAADSVTRAGTQKSFATRAEFGG